MKSPSPFFLLFLLVLISSCEIDSFQLNRVKPLQAHKIGKSTRTLRFGSSLKSAALGFEEETVTPERQWKEVLPPLIATCRLSNVPGACFMAICGAFRACRMLRPITLLSFLRTEILTLGFANILLCLSLVTATSMVVNDYFDARSGTDCVNVEKDSSTLLDKPMSDGTVPLPYAKKFVSILYSTLLIAVCFLPQVGTRLAVVISSILTFLYTNQIKPFTFWKNLSCATVIACTPLMGGINTMRGLSPSLHTISLVYASLTPLVSAIFFGILHREILMDIQDVPGDRAANIRTIPVVYGATKAASVALGSVTLMSGVVVRECLRAMKAGLCWKCYLRPSLGLIGVSVIFYRCLSVLRATTDSKTSQGENLPSIYSWELTSNTIVGKIYGSESFEDGEAITTSSLTTDFSTIKDSSVVVTESGSRYLLKGGECEEQQEEKGEQNDAVFDSTAVAIDEGKLTMFMVLMALS